MLGVRKDYKNSHHFCSPVICQHISKFLDFPLVSSLELPYESDVLFPLLQMRKIKLSTFKKEPCVKSHSQQRTEALNLTQSIHILIDLILPIYRYKEVNWSGLSPKGGEAGQGVHEAQWNNTYTTRKMCSAKAEGTYCATESSRNKVLINSPPRKKNLTNKTKKPTCEK